MPEGMPDCIPWSATYLFPQALPPWLECQFRFHNRALFTNLWVNTSFSFYWNLRCLRQCSLCLLAGTVCLPLDWSRQGLLCSSVPFACLREEKRKRNLRQTFHFFFTDRFLCEVNKSHRFLWVPLPFTFCFRCFFIPLTCLTQSQIPNGPSLDPRTKPSPLAASPTLPARSWS